MSRTLLLLASCCLSLAALADEPATEPPPTLQLGTVSVTGERKIMETLQAIKVALHAPFSSDAAHANYVVCRINKSLGEAREYLDCATNRDFTQRREATQTTIMIGTYGVPGGGNPLDYFVAAQPNHQLHMPVQGAALRALLARVPDAPTDEGARLQASPAAATRVPPASTKTPAPGAQPVSW